MPGAIARYQRKVSGPLLDRIDIYLEVPAVEVEKLSQDLKSEDSKDIRDRVIKARRIQSKRFGDNIRTNSEMNNIHIKEYCKVTVEGLELLKQAIVSFYLSARGYHRVLKLSRTIADLADSEVILTEHLAEALQYRAKEES